MRGGLQALLKGSLKARTVPFSDFSVAAFHPLSN